MELYSLAVAVGSVGASALVKANAEHIVNVIDDCLKKVMASEGRIQVEQRPSSLDSGQADLRLD